MSYAGTNIQKMQRVCLGAIVFAMAAITSPLHAEVTAIGPDWRFNGTYEAPVRVLVSQVVYEGARAPSVTLTASPLRAGVNVKTPGVVSQAVNIQLSKQSVLSFKARFTVQGSAKPELTVQLKGRGINKSRVFGTPDGGGTAAAEGFHSFEWPLSDVVLTAGGQLGDISLLLDYKALEAQDALKVEIIDLVFKQAAAAPIRQATEVAPSRWVTTPPVKYRDVPLQGWKAVNPEGASAIKIENVTVNTQGRDEPALRITYDASKTFSAIALPISLNVDQENVLTFRAKVEAPQGSKQLGDVQAPLTGLYSYQFNAFFDNFGVGFEDDHSFAWTAAGVPTTHFLQHLDHTVPEADGFKSFKWDIKNDNPTGNKGFDLEIVSRIMIFYDNKKLAPGQQVVITIIKPQLVTGLSHTGGDMEKFATFKKEMDAYKPDYSDSSRYLSAPAQGRLDQPLALVKDRHAVGEIVGRASLWDPEGLAVRELYQWLFKLTGGAEVPIVNKPSADGPATQTRIHVGIAHAKALFPEDIEALKNSEGCAIRTRGNDVYIFGATPKGTLNGVYVFLEANSDIIWPRPSDIYGAVYTEHADLSVTWGDFLHRAPARHWGWMGKTTGPQFDYQVRNRANYLGLRSDVNFKYWGLFMEEGGGHNLHSWIPFSLWKTHPEYWAMLDGKRQHPNGYKNQICLSNSDGRDIFQSNLLRRILLVPQAQAADCYNIKIEDNWGVCECEECTRPIRLHDGTLLPSTDIAFRSTQFFIFLNGVANHLHNYGLPRIQIGTYVYFYTVPVPKVPVTTTLRPYFCPYVRKDQKVPLYAPKNDVWWRIVNEWTQVSDKVVMREYHGLYVGFRPLADVASYDIRALLDAGVYEFTSESLGEDGSQVPGGSIAGMDVAAMEYWVITRLYWDPQANVQELRKYFLRRTYREAAPALEKFFGTIHQLYYAEKRTSDFEENQEILQLVLRLGKDQELNGYLDDALAAVKHPQSRIMVNLLRDRYVAWMAELKSKQEKSGR